MKPVRFPSKIPRRMKGSFDPVDIFKEVVDLPCVTFNEYLVYEYLLDEVRYLSSALVGPQKGKLTSLFTEAGQLLVSWRGRPDSSSKSVLVAHVDREGLLVRGFDSLGSIARCWHTAGRPPDGLKNSKVRLYTPGQVMYGVIQEVSPYSQPSGEAPFEHEIVVRVERQNRANNAKFFKNQFFEGFGVYDIPTYSMNDGIISAANVDNVAGVSILVSLLNGVIRNSWRVNVDFLFTTCEEAGFCGVVAEILNGVHLTSKTDGEVVCIDVDSSNHMNFVDEWQFWTLEEKNSIEEIPLQHTVIRTGDKGSYFDSEVTQMLSAAARNLSASQTRHERIQWTGRKRPSVSQKLRESFKTVAKEDGLAGGIKPGTAVGRMLGGFCEATPLVHQSELRSTYGDLGPLQLRTGAVAVPIANYRNYVRRALSPEKCHQSALGGVRDLLGEAIRLTHRWPFGTAPSHTKSDARDTNKEIVERLLSKQELYADLLSVGKDWIRQNT